MEVTEAAAAVIQALREREGAPDEAGIRIQAVPGDAGQPTIGMSFESAPDPNDEITEQSGVKVFVEEALTDQLSEAVIDARSTDEGAQLVVRV